MPDPAPAELSAFGRMIDAALDRYTQPRRGCPTVLRDAMRYSLLGAGKRLRPALVLLAARACGSTLERAMPAACAVEMVHTYSLIHDDLPAMDDDDLRRGKPACHVAFDEATAILAGDALLARAFELLACEVEPAELAARCVRILSHAAGDCGLVGGQSDDLTGAASAEGHPGTVEERLQSIHERKTGALIHACLHLGAVIGQADDQQRQQLLAYGHHFGLAFQITDDLLDFRGRPEQMGKRVGKDQQRGKLTFPGVMGYDASRRKAESLIERACAAVQPFGDRGQPLQELARFVTSRSC